MSDPVIITLVCYAGIMLHIFVVNILIQSKLDNIRSAITKAIEGDRAKKSGSDSERLAR